jgi:hypothetical protein
VPIIGLSSVTVSKNNNSMITPENPNEFYADWKAPVDREQVETISQHEVAKRISEQIRKNRDDNLNFDTESLNKRQTLLAERPVIDSGDFKDITSADNFKTTFSWVQLNKIVGRPSAAQNPGGWSFEYSARKGRIAEIAEELSRTNEDVEAVEHVFHLRKPSERIKLYAIEGPMGPMYTVEDGTHRVAGSMAAELQEIPCDVKRAEYPLLQITSSEEDYMDWQAKIKMGLIDGSIEISEDETGNKSYELTVQSEVLPWIRTSSQNKLIEISKLYEELYPGSLDELEIPRDVLLDPIANNYFMAGRWAEWDQKFANKPKDANRLTVYD